MPLYMDIHKVDSENFSVEDVVKAHMQDLEVEERFGVKQIKYWVNEDSRTIFCLMKGPDKGACVAVHEASHGQTACNIVEVSDDEYDLFLNMGSDKNDLAHHKSGEIDLGNRFLLYIEIFSEERILEKLGNHLQNLVSEHQGSISYNSKNSCIACFDSIQETLSAYMQWLEFKNQLLIPIEFSSTLIAGELLQETTSSVFEDVLKKIEIISKSAPLNCLNIDDFTNHILNQESIESRDLICLNIVNTQAFNTFQKISIVCTHDIFEPNFKPTQLNKTIGFSRAQTYRIIKNFTGYSPSNFIKTIRLKAAYSSLLHEDRSISEIAYKYGFSSPAYFSKSFKTLFHNAPSEIVMRH